MGAGASSAQGKISDDERRRHKAAEAVLAEEKKRSADVFKLLLLGTGDSGKSTIVKQMKILHRGGFDKEEVNRQRSLIAGNILHSLCAIVNAMIEFGIKFDSAEREVDSTKILTTEKEWLDGEMRLTFEMWASLKRLWADAGVQASFARSNEYQLADSTKYFCDDMERISDQDYIPTDQDMLRTRVSTIGIVEIEFTLRGLTLNIIDVGGQRSQRKKWIHCFENVNALIFVAAVSEYNQVLFEDSEVNRMHETLVLFGTIINTHWFSKASVVLFLNKRDLFEEKIKKYPLTFAFPEYEGSNDYDSAIGYVQMRFETQKLDPKKIIYTHRTCATDTKNVEFVMDACFDIILTKNINKSGMY